jgi:galactose mutarotase-like enzyme
MQELLVSNTLTVTINSKGAEISSVKNKEGLEFVWQAKQEVWPRHAPVLFPIVGKLKDNTFSLNDQVYELSQHGFARDHEFTLVQKNASLCVYELKPNAETKKLYPFDFVLKIKYELKDNFLTTSYIVTNPNDTDLLFSIGAHPGFNCPLTKGETFEDYFLEFGSDRLSLTELNNGLRRPSTGSGTGAKKDLVLKDKKLHLTKNLFDNDALVFENRQIDKVTLRSEKSGHKITIECIGWPYFGIWSKKGCTEFVCLEPWYGIADHENSTGDLHKKEGIIQLKPHQQFSCSFTMSFE